MLTKTKSTDSSRKILEIRVTETVFSQKLLDKQDDGTYNVKKSLNTHDKRCQAIIKAS